MKYNGHSLPQIQHFSVIKKNCGGQQVSCFVEQPRIQRMHILLWIYRIFKFIIVNKSTNEFVGFVLAYCVCSKDFKMKINDKNGRKGYEGEPQNILVFGLLQRNMKMKIFHMRTA